MTFAKGFFWKNSFIDRMVFISSSLIWRQAIEHGQVLGLLPVSG